jgi:hypothetical protein
MSDTADELRESLEAMCRDFNAREPDAVLARMTDDVEWANGWEGGYLKGHGEVRSYWVRRLAELDLGSGQLRHSARRRIPRASGVMQFPG